MICTSMCGCQRRTSLQPDASFYLNHGRGMLEHALKRIGRNAFGVEILFPFLPRVATQGVRGRRMSLPQIPKGFRPKAQGCDAGETLGKRMKMISTPKALRLPFHRNNASIIIRCLYPSGIFHKRTTTLFARFQTAPKHACVFGCGLKTAGLCAHCGRWSRGSRASPGAIRTHRHAGGMGQRIETGLQ